MTPTPTIGRIVFYTLSEYDVATIEHQRRELNFHGNSANAGDVFPMMITRVWGPDSTSAVNGTVFLDGQDTLWATSVCVGEGPHTFQWPVIPRSS